MRSHPTIVLIAITCGASAGQSRSSNALVTGSIQFRAEKAKDQGETSLTIRTPRGMFENISSLDEALSTYHVVISTPIKSEAQLVDSNHIYTWYKLKAVEKLVHHPNPEVPAVSIPEALLPVGPEEIVIRVPQGTVTVDGVRVTAVDPDSRLLTLNDRYLFFLSPDSTGKFAYLRAGPNAIFRISPENKIVPLVDKQNQMQPDVEASTSGSLDSLRHAAKAKAVERLRQQ